MEYCSAPKYPSPNNTLHTSDSRFQTIPSHTVHLQCNTVPCSIHRLDNTAQRLIRNGMCTSHIGTPQISYISLTYGDYFSVAFPAGHQSGVTQARRTIHKAPFTLDRLNSIRPNHPDNIIPEGHQKLSIHIIKPRMIYLTKYGSTNIYIYIYIYPYKDKQKKKV